MIGSSGTTICPLRREIDEPPAGGLRELKLGILFGDDF